MTKRLQIPIAGTTARNLKLGDRVLLSGQLVTARDALHRYLYDGGNCPVDLHDGVIYHCGPVVVPTNGTWTVKAAGPTTSIREEPYMRRLIGRLHLRAILGKGGMGPQTRKACAEHGCVYLHAVGGAGQVLAGAIERVADVHFLKEFGPSEAMWVLQVKNFPAVVTIDCRGRSLHKKIADLSRKNLRALLAEEF